MSTTPSTFRSLTTERLVLRSPEVADAPTYVAIFTNPKNLEHNPHENGPDEHTIAKYEDFLTKTYERNQKGEKALFAVCLKDADGNAGPMIGMCGFPWLPANAEGRPGNTGVLIDSHYARKGYASESLVVTLDYGFDVLGFETIEQDTGEENIPYRTLMQSMGLDKFGKRKEPNSKGQVRWFYTVNKAQWKDLREALVARRR